MEAPDERSRSREQWQKVGWYVIEGLAANAAMSLYTPPPAWALDGDTEHDEEPDWGSR